MRRRAGFSTSPVATAIWLYVGHRDDFGAFWMPMACPAIRAPSAILVQRFNNHGFLCAQTRYPSWQADYIRLPR